MKKCKFDKAWIGKCKNDADESGYCEEHKDIMCCSCGAKATHECSETMGLVCGAPLCDDCEHTINSNGCNSGGTSPEGLKSHCKKSDQKYFSWYVVDYVKNNPETQEFMDKFNNGELTYLETQEKINKHCEAKQKSDEK